VPETFSICLDLDRDEVLALLSYIAIGLHILAIAGGNGGSLSPDEFNSHLGNINADAADRLTQKLTAAIQPSNPDEGSNPNS